MTCRESQRRLAEMFDSAAPPVDLREHLAACAECAREYAGIQAAMALIEPPVRIQASPGFKERVMKDLTKSAAPSRMDWRSMFPRVAVVCAAVVLIVVLAPVVASLATRQARGPVVGLLAQSVQAMSNLQSVHIKARMRTIARDNFEYIDSARDWVPVEIWKQFGEMPKWRVEKTGGRVVVMDGVSSVMFSPPNFAWQGGPRAGFLEWLQALLDPDQILESELAAARAGKSTAMLQEGAGEMVLTVHRSPGGSGDWLYNKTVSSSDQTRVYRFDKGTKRLTGMQLIVHAAGGDASVFEILGVTYNEPVDPALFTLTLPENVVRDVSPAEMPTANRPLPQSPKEAAQVLFDALSKEDWELARTVWPRSAFSDDFKRGLGGLKVISLGEPFQPTFYPGWFVPYEIRFKNGYVKKHNLAVRNDNQSHRWVFDGGL